MSYLKSINDKGAVLEWCPLSSYSSVVALGSKESAGGGFDDYGGEIEIHKLDFSDTKSSTSKLLGKAKASARFASLAWSKMSTHASVFPMGIIAGGMLDGEVNIWNPMAISKGENGLVSCLQHHQGAVQGLHFNPHAESSTLLASGGNDGEVYIISLEDPENPVVFTPSESNNSKHSADVTKVAWNSQVAHILASSSQNGSCFIWDLKQKKAWCELRDPAGGSITDIAWNPEQGLNIVTASGDDKNPVIKLWDLRSSTSLPLATLQGHSQGILSVSWCPSDPSLLMSCGKDNRTILWDLFHAKAVYDLPSGGGATVPETSFGGIGNAAGQRKYHVSWSPCIPAVIGTCSFDRNVQFYSLSGVKSNIGRAPKWLRRPVGASFGFGGKLVVFSSRADNRSGEGGKKGSSSSRMTVYQASEDAALVTESDHFHAAIANGDFRAVCEEKALISSTAHDREEWNIIRLLCFEADTRENLITHLGFSKEAIDASAKAFSVSQQGGIAVQESPALASTLAKVLSFSNKEEVDQLFSSANSSHGKADNYRDLSPPRKSVALTVNETAAVEAQIAIEREAEPMIRNALVVGNFEAAVDCCLEAGLMAEALLLSQCGNTSLWEKTQKAFFERQKRIHRLPFLDMLQAVIRNELRAFVQNSELYKWRETLALLSTYAKAEEFPVMCEFLATRLESEAGDLDAAKICYMCAMNFTKTISLWVEDLKTANSAVGGCDNLALWKFIMKVVMFTHSSPSLDLGSECAEFFSKYAHILASHGRLDTAPRYIRGENLSESILRDRVYHASAKATSARAPPFPFQKVVVSVQGTSAAATNVDAQQTAVHEMPRLTRGVTGGLTDRPSPMSRGSSLENPNISSRASHWPESVAASTVVNTIPVPVVAPQLAANVLPPGWIQLLDPASGRPYFANQATGQTQWEPPVPAQSVPVVVPVPVPSVQSQVQQMSPATVHVGFSQVSASLASSVASNQVRQPAATTPISATASGNPLGMQQVQPAVATTANCEAVLALHHIISLLEESSNAADKKQLAMVTTACNILGDRVSANAVAPDVVDKVAGIVSAINSRNFSAANVIQADLANTVWAQHKDWIKGLKTLVQLAAKR